MKKSIFLLSFLLLIISITPVKAEDKNYILIGCDSIDLCSYDLEENNLPDNISWDKEKKELTLDNYAGGSIYLITNSNIILNLKGTNIISINKDLNYGIKINNYNLTIISKEEGSLTIENNQNKNQNNIGITTDQDIIMTSGDININLKGESNYKAVACDDLYIEEESSLKVDLDTTSKENQYGIYNNTSITINTKKTVTINLSNIENPYIYRVGPLNYDNDSYIGNQLESANENYFNIAYKITNKINIEEEKGKIILNKTMAETNDQISFEINPNPYHKLSSINFYNLNNKDITEKINYNKENNTFIMPPYEITIKVTFIPIIYNIYKDNILNGSFEVQKTSTYGEKIKLNIYPNAGYKFKNVNIKNSFTKTDITSGVNFNEEDYSFDMPGCDININVFLEKKEYQITKINSENGTYKINNSENENISAVYLNKVRITEIKPNSNYSSTNYNVYILNNENEVINNLVNYNNYDKTFIMPNYNVKVKIVFNKIGYTIKKEITGRGDIEVKSDANSGDEVEITVTSEKDYIIKSINFYDYLHPAIKLDIKLNNNLGKYIFKMPNNFITIKANFIKKPTIPKVNTKLYGYDDVQITWNKINDAEGYYIYYKKNTSKSYSYLGKTKNLSYKKANLYDGIKYNFKIIAYTKDINNKEYQAYQTSNIYTLKKIKAPTIQKYSKNYTKVKWNNIPGETGYQISRSTKKTGTYIVKNASSKYNAITTKTARNKKYYYKIRAYKTENNKKIYGPWSYAKAFTLR